MTRQLLAFGRQQTLATSLVDLNVVVQDMAALIAYLKSLDVRQVPGVTDTVLHFATIVTPDADPVKRAGMLDVLPESRHPAVHRRLQRPLQNVVHVAARVNKLGNAGLA